VLTRNRGIALHLFRKLGVAQLSLKLDQALLKFFKPVKHTASRLCVQTLLAGNGETPPGQKHLAPEVSARGTAF
jgi:hypothetical protein